MSESMSILPMKEIENHGNLDMEVACFVYFTFFTQMDKEMYGMTWI